MLFNSNLEENIVNITNFFKKYGELIDDIDDRVSYNNERICGGSVDGYLLKDLFENLKKEQAIEKSKNNEL